MTCWYKRIETLQTCEHHQNRPLNDLLIQKNWNIISCKWTIWIRRDFEWLVDTKELKPKMFRIWDFCFPALNDLLKQKNWNFKFYYLRAWFCLWMTCWYKRIETNAFFIPFIPLPTLNDLLIQKNWNLNDLFVNRDTVTALNDLLIQKNWNSISSVEIIKSLPLNDLLIQKNWNLRSW